MRKLLKYTIFLTATAAFTAPLALADESNSDESALAGEKPLSEVIKSVEDKGYEQISEVSMDDRVWELEATKDGENMEIKVDPHTGDIISEERD